MICYWSFNKLTFISKLFIISFKFSCVLENTSTSFLLFLMMLCLYISLTNYFVLEAATSSTSSILRTLLALLKFLSSHSSVSLWFYVENLSTEIALYSSDSFSSVSLDDSFPSEDILLIPYELSSFISSLIKFNSFWYSLRALAIYMVWYLHLLWPYSSISL